MAMENKRIIQLSTERTTLTSGDYVMVDSETDGSAKYRLDRLKETDSTLSVSGMAADAAATGQAISEETQARTQAVTAESQARAAADTTLGNDVQDLKSALDYNGINNTFDGNLYNGYWSSSGVLTSAQNDVCCATKIPCPANANVVLITKTNVTDYKIYISYFDEEGTTRLRRDISSSAKYEGVSPTGTYWFTFTYEHPGITKDNFGTAEVYINNAISGIKNDIESLDTKIDNTNRALAPNVNNAFQAKIRNELDFYGTYTIIADDLINGTVNKTSTYWNKYVKSDKRIRTACLLPMKEKEYIDFVPGSMINKLIISYDKAGYNDVTLTSSGRVNIVTDANICLIFTNTSDQNITPADFDATLIIRGAIKNNIKFLDEVVRTGKYIYKQDDIIQGSYLRTNIYTFFDAINASPVRIRAFGFIDVRKNMKLSFKPGTNTQKLMYGELNMKGTGFIDNGWYEEEFSMEFDRDMKIIMIFAKLDNSNIVPSEFDAIVELTMDSQAENEILPSSYPEEVGFKKSQQMTNIKWTPSSPVPMARGENYFPANVQRTGMLYSDAHTIGKTVGHDVSLRTFMTCIHNPYSLLYTENINEDHSESAYGNVYHGDSLAGAYMGSACNLFVTYALGCLPYSSFEMNGWCVDAGIFDRIYDQSGNGLKLMDVIWIPSHVRLVTRLWKNDRGVVEKIQISECTQGGAINNNAVTVAQFNTLLAQENGVILRYRDLYKNIYYEPSPFVLVENEKTPPFVYNDDICTFAGDYACFAEGDKIYINYTKSSYTQMELYKNDTLMDTINLDASSDVHEVNLTGMNLTYGKYKARLKDGSNYSDYTYFEIINAEIQLSGDTLNFETANATPIYFVWAKASNGYSYKKTAITAEEVAEGEADVSDRNAAYTVLKVYFQGDYGRIFRSISE